MEPSGAGNTGGVGEPTPPVACPGLGRIIHVKHLRGEWLPGIVTNENGKGFRATVFLNDDYGATRSQWYWVSSHGETWRWPSTLPQKPHPYVFEPVGTEGMVTYTCPSPMRSTNT